MILNRYELVSLKKIRIWEKKQKTGRSEKLSDAATKKIDGLVKKIGPEKFRALEKGVEETLQKIISVSFAGKDADDILEKANNYGIAVSSLKELARTDLSRVDEFIAAQLNIQGRIAAYRAACLGAAGVIAAKAEMSALLIQTFRMVQTVALCYGFNTELKSEKEIILRIIMAATGGSDIKFQNLREISALQEDMRESDDSNIEPISQNTGILSAEAVKGYASLMAYHLLSIIMTRLMPVISIILAFRKSHRFISQCAETAFMVYRKRFIERKIRLK